MKESGNAEFSDLVLSVLSSIDKNDSILNFLCSSYNTEINNLSEVCEGSEIESSCIKLLNASNLYVNALTNKVEALESALIRIGSGSLVTNKDLVNVLNNSGCETDLSTSSMSVEEFKKLLANM